jgi:hypothetical protein
MDQSDSRRGRPCSRIFSLLHDPWPYVGGFFVVLALPIGVAAIVQSARPATIFVVLLAAIPFALTALALYFVATRTS